MIAVRNLSKKYGTNEVLKSINIQFEKGKVLLAKMVQEKQLCLDASQA